MKIKKIKNIIFPTDFSNESLESLKAAVKFSKLSNSKLIVLNVVDTPFNFNMENESVELDLILHDLIYFSKSKLETIFKQIKVEFGFDIETLTYTGETTKSITKAVDNYNADLVIMSTKVSKDLFFKSNSFNIVKNTSIPLLSLSPSNNCVKFNTILFPFNETFMTLKKVDEVLQIAKIFKSKIVLLGILAVNTLEKRQIITNNLTFLKSVFEKNKIECEVHFKQNNNYSKVILDYCKENTIDLVTIANNLPTYLKENFANTFAKDVINHSAIPVLTVPVGGEI